MLVRSTPVSLRRARRGGNNHASVPSAIRMLGLLLLLLCGVASAPALAQEDPLVQRGVPAEATAETAVLAREQALNSGQRLAYERMAASLGLAAGASTQQIESMVRSLVIESERITARTYTARITVNFNPQAVAAAGGRAPAGAPLAAPAPLDGTLPANPAPPAMASGPTVATVEALASYRSFAEWVEITRRLESAPPVARVQVVSVAGDRARLRLGLRSQAPDAALALASVGLALSPIEPRDPRFGATAAGGEGWRLSLAGFR